MTRTGHERAHEELKRLKGRERPRIVAEIKAARELGDLSENAEYHAAKEKQGQIEGRIRLLEDRLARAEVVDPSAQSLDRIRFGTTVELEDLQSGESVTYTIVGEIEADASAGMISFNSPIARALIGKCVEDEVTVRVPSGTREFEVIEIRVEA